ncbi:tail fiber protein [Okeania sp. SIO2B3]|uniref:tail fiber protein n=1 Tax=Okeania sp. SIO2B3 TaxID=2607784 RepID=UPI0013BFF182|nr:tail fiber protein [Okeania sp. SIO2B3]NET44903.1 tail fiber protein [Okeania sp. SIO2B3]
MNKKRIFGAAIAILLAVTLIFGTQVNSASAGEVPIGTITAYGGLVDGSAKGQLEGQGWLVCDGDAYLRDEYSELYQIIGGSFGTGDNVTTFNVPDLRGRFVRGVDHGAGQDPDAEGRTESAPGSNTGDKVGSYQEDAVGPHTHPLPFSDRNQSKGNSGGRQGVYDEEGDLSTESSGGDETRPKNIYVNWIIKAKDVNSSQERGQSLKGFEVILK